MDKEYALMILPSISWLLFSLGGKTWKGWRRYILPLVYLAFMLTYGIAVNRACLVTLLAIFMFCLGYGESKPYWYKFLVGYGYGLISTPIGVSFWNYLTPIAFISLFWLSNNKPFSNIFVWKICEGFIGLLIGLTIAVQL